MAECGVPTLTCVLLLLFIAALYAGVNSNTNDGIDKYRMDELEIESFNGHKMSDRIARSSRGRGRTTNNRKSKERLADDDDQDTTSIRRRGGQSNDKKKGERKRPDGGKRPRPSNKKDGLPPGINRRMMRLAEKIHSASTPFAARLFKTVTSQLTHNIVLSPLSVHTALTMTMLGAKGRTKKEMVNVLGHRQAKLGKKKPHQAYKALLSSLQSVHPEVKISSANAVFVKPNIPLEDAFRQGLTEMYNATFDSFQYNHPQGPEAPINSWVSNITHHRIQRLLTPGAITPLTAMVLVNVIYFNASWSYQFIAYETSPGQFNTLAGGIKNVDMMQAVHDLGYANHYNTEVIELPYKGDRLVMYILLPNPTFNITQLQQDLLNPEDAFSSVDRMLENLTTDWLRLHMPKFKIETEVLNLKELLKKMGIVRAFDKKQADFSGISTDRHLYIDEVVHKAFIEVSEGGTEAGGAAGVINVPISAILYHKEVKVDRPFMFVIRDKVFKEILFMGTYVG